MNLETKDSNSIVAMCIGSNVNTQPDNCCNNTKTVDISSEEDKTHAENNVKDLCPICLECFGNDNITYCERRHSVHTSCITEYYNITSKCLCPICRIQIVIPNLIIPNNYSDFTNLPIPEYPSINFTNVRENHLYNFVIPIFPNINFEIINQDSDNDEGVPDLIIQENYNYDDIDAEDLINPRIFEFEIDGRICYIDYNRIMQDLSNLRRYQIDSIDYDRLYQDLSDLRRIYFIDFENSLNFNFRMYNIFIKIFQYADHLQRISSQTFTDLSNINYERINNLIINFHNETNRIVPELV